jgi:glycosyltransferase involved in cell wall biosynthesis
MRILLVVPMVPQADGLGAIPKLMHTQLFGLLEHHDVTMIGSFGDLPGQAEAATALESSGLDVHFADRRRSPRAPRRWSVRAQLVSNWVGRPWPWSVVSLVAGVQPLLDRALAKGKYDLAAIEHNAMSALRYPSGLPAVLTEHEAARSAAGARPASGLTDRPLAALRARDWRRWQGFQPGAWRSAELVQVFSRGDAAAIAERAADVADRVRVNPYGIEMPAAADPDLEVAGTVLFTGTFTHPPNRDAAHWLAEEIMPAVRERQPQAVLRIVGSAPPQEIRDLAGPGVEIVADAPSVEAHLQAATVVIAPVRSGGGMRMKVLEALARGKAVVTTPLGAEGFTELEPEPPLAVAADAAGIAAETAVLLGDERRRGALGRSAREFAQRHYSPSAWSRRLAAVYEEARRPDRPGRQNRPA